MRTKGEPFIDKNRLALCRRQMGYTMEELAAEIGKVMGKGISLSAISHWEKGTRIIPRKYGEVFTIIFGVTLDYLRGLTDDPHGIVESVAKEEGLEEVPYERVADYDGRPLWVEFVSGTGINGWGIIDALGSNVVMVSRTYKISKTRMRFYPEEPGYAMLQVKLDRVKRPSMDEFFRAKRLYVEYDSPDPGIRKLYGGWYKHNENNTALVNDDGLVLPYGGLDKYYKCTRVFL